MVRLGDGPAKISPPEALDCCPDVSGQLFQIGTIATKTSKNLTADP